MLCSHSGLHLQSSTSHTAAKKLSSLSPIAPDYTISHMELELPRQHHIFTLIPFT